MYKGHDKIFYFTDLYTEGVDLGNVFKTSNHDLISYAPWPQCGVQGPVTCASAFVCLLRLASPWQPSCIFSLMLFKRNQMTWLNKHWKVSVYDNFKPIMNKVETRLKWFFNWRIICRQQNSADCQQISYTTFSSSVTPLVDYQFLNPTHHDIQHHKAVNRVSSLFYCSFCRGHCGHVVMVFN